MKINNPWPHYPSTRCVCKPSDTVVMAATRGDIELPDGTEEVLLTPVKMRARGKYDEVGQTRIWSDEFGLLDVEDHMKKVEIKEESAKLEERRKQERLRFEEKRNKEAEEKYERIEDDIRIKDEKIDEDPAKEAKTYEFHKEGSVLLDVKEVAEDEE